MEEPIVTVKSGKLRGKVNITENGFQYYSFNGIPYAKPPVNKLRFKDPVPFGSWTGIRDATKQGNNPTQYSNFTYELSGDDDCLFLNVHTPNFKKSGKPLPVMIQIHGGGFTEGSGDAELFGPDYLVEKNVILASINYRLGVLGFLCTDPVNARGDMGLKDQNMALRWIKDNVESFGGDPNNITLFGESAGAASVEYHMLSDMSKDLFDRAIIQSASVFIPCTRSPYPIKMARKLAQRLGYNSTDDDGLFDFINGFDSMKLVETAMNLMDNDDLKNGYCFPFVPAINVFDDNMGFLNEEPADIMKSGRFKKCPVIAGVCDKEGIFMKHFYRFDEPTRDMEEGKFLDYIPDRLNKNFIGGNERLKKIYRKRPEDRNEEEDIIDFNSDLTINGGVWFALEQRLKHCEEPQYFYNFSHEGKLAYFIFESKNGKQLVGATHADELGYMAKIDIPLIGDRTPTPEDVAVRTQIVEMWSNFAKFGNPTPENSKVKWLPIEENQFRYLELNVNFEMKKEFYDDRRELWREIYSTL